MGVSHCHTNRIRGRYNIMRFYKPYRLKGSESNLTSYKYSKIAWKLGLRRRVQSDIQQP